MDNKNNLQNNKPADTKNVSNKDDYDQYCTIPCTNRERLCGGRIVTSSVFGDPENSSGLGWVL
jgi:hypothetical protein